MCQDDIAARVGLEKSTGAPGKTTARQESALLRMVHEDRFKSDCALNERMKNLYGVCVGHKTINNGLVASGYRVCRTLRKPLLTANHRRLRLYWARGWQNCRENASSKTARLTCQVDRVQAGGWGWGWGGLSTGVPLVLLDRNVSGMVYGDILRNTLVPFAMQHFGDNFHYQDENAMPHHSKVVTDCLQQEDITEIDQPAQPFDCNPIEHLWDELGHAINNMGHPPHNFSRNFARPCGISGPISPWKACSVWGPACPGDQRPLSELGTVTHHDNHSTLEICDYALYVWNCSMIGYVLTNARKFESPYLMEFHFAQYSGTIHLKTIIPHNFASVIPQNLITDGTHAKNVTI